MGDDVNAAGLEPVLTVEVALGPALEQGTTRVGIRRVIPVLRGTVTGGFEAEVLPGGSDWQRVRPDGTAEIDARYCAVTPTGELISMQVRGLRRAAEPGERPYFRATVDFETSSADLADFQNHLYVATGERTDDTVRHIVYRVT